MVMDAPGQRPSDWYAFMPWTAPDAMGTWFEATTWWGGRDDFTSPRRMLVELVEAIAGRFLGRQLTLDIRGRQLTLTLGEVSVESDARSRTLDPFAFWLQNPATQAMTRLARSFVGEPEPAPPEPAYDRLHLAARAVAIDERALGDVGATVENVHLEFGTTAELVTGTVQLEVRSTRAAVIAWVRQALPEWHLDLHVGDLISARHRRWPASMRLIARPELVGIDSVNVRVVGIRVFGWDLRLPGRLVRSRLYSLPPLTDELEVVDARIEGDEVLVHLTHPGLRQPVRLEQVRAVIHDGISRFTANVFT